MEPRRSSWTGREAPRLVEVRLPAVTRWGTPQGEETHLVEPEHEAALRRFVGYAVRNARFALVSYLACALLALAGALLGPRTPTGGLLLVLGLLLLGASLVAYPFATPETVARLGFRRSRNLARVVGVCVWLLAIVIAAIGG